MKTTSSAELTQYCEAKKIARSDRTLRYLDSSFGSVRFPLPTKGLKIFALSHALTGYLQSDDYRGSLFWLVEAGMWSNDTEAIGDFIFKRMGIPLDTSIEINCWFLGPDELVAQKALLVLTMMFQWDAYFVPSHGEHYVFMSHDGYVQIFANAEPHYDKASRLAKNWSVD